MTRALLLALVLLASPAGAAQSAPGGGPIAGADSYAVYATVLATGWPKPDLPRAEIAVEEKTAGHDLCAGWTLGLAPEWQSAAQDYAQQNETPRRLSPGFDLRVPYTLITSEKYDDLIMIAAGDPAKVFADFWGGMSLAFSAVGFDSSKTHAIVTLQYSCPGGCAGGRAFLLEKQAGHWDVTMAKIPVCEW